MSALIKARDIIIVGQQPWDVNIGSNCKDIALEFSKHNRVLYVNPPLDRITKFRRKNEPHLIKRKNVVDGKVKGLSIQHDNLWELNPNRLIESINWIKVHFLFNLLNKRNNWLFAASIAEAAKELDFKDFILFNDNDIFRSYYLKEFLKPAISIYYSRDFMLGVDYWRFHGKLLEPALIEKSDLVVANSIYLTNYCRKYNPNSKYVGQGCDLNQFVDSPELKIPHSLESIPHPRIGYVGSLNSDRLDIDILIYVAIQHPDWSVVLVGPADARFEASELQGLSNVYFLGLVPEKELSAHIKGFDVCLNPQLVNEITIGNYPRKIDEYLAMGKAVVATKTEAMEAFKDHVYLTNSKEGYVSCIEKALAENDSAITQERIKYASDHTWENSVGEIYQAIEKTLHAKLK